MSVPYSPIKCGDEAPELAVALGDMVLAWTHVEQIQIDCFTAILETQHYKASRLYQKLPNFRSRTQALLTLTELHPAYETLRPEILKLSKLSKTRNGWIHGEIIKAWRGTDMRAIDLDEPLDSPKRSKPIKAADIRNHSDATRAVADALSVKLRNLPGYKGATGAPVLRQE